MNDFERYIPENVRRFINRHVDSVIALEVLLLMYRQPQQEWSAAEVADELRIDRAWTSARLNTLVNDGVIYKTGDVPVYRYYPATLEMNAAVAALTSTYAERPLTVISYIYSRPAIVSLLADAFRLRD